MGERMRQPEGDLPTVVIWRQTAENRGQAYIDLLPSHPEAPSLLCFYSAAHALEMLGEMKKLDPRLADFTTRKLTPGELLGAIRRFRGGGHIGTVAFLTLTPEELRAEFVDAGSLAEMPGEVFALWLAARAGAPTLEAASTKR
jgi:hypothetical protein